MSTFIKQFEELTGFKFEGEGNIGLGAFCVGMVNTDTQSYAAYEMQDRSQHIYHEVAIMTQPHKAYRRGGYLAVTYDGSEIDRQRAINDLDQWIEKIMAAGFEVKKFKEYDSLAALAMGGCAEQKCLGGGIEYSKFKEVFQK